MKASTSTIQETLCSKTQIYQMKNTSHKWNYSETRSSQDEQTKHNFYRGKSFELTRRKIKCQLKNVCIKNSTQIIKRLL